MTSKNISIGNINFGIGTYLGQGIYGQVFKINYEGKPFAIKIINSDREGIVSLRELDVMTRLKHTNLAKAKHIISHFEGEGKEKVKYGILIDLAEMDLFKTLSDLSWNVDSRLYIFYQITNGLKFLHDNKYLHLDIKPSNILLYENKNSVSNGNNKLLYRCDGQCFAHESTGSCSGREVVAYTKKISKSES